MTHHGLRRGFTLPEVLLAVILFALGLLGLASSATFIARESGDARRLVDAAQFAAARLDSLHATPCTSLTGGGSVSVVGSIQWSVTPAPQTRLVHATFTLATRGTHSFTFDLLLPCDG